MSSTISPPASNTEPKDIESQVQELKQLINDQESIIDKRIANLESISSRVANVGSSDDQAFGILNYKLTDFLVKLERRLQNQPPQEAISTNGRDKAMPTQAVDSGTNGSFRYDNSFECDPRQEQDLTINQTYDSLTSAANTSESPAEAVQLLQTYLNSILNIIKPNVKNNFSDILESTGELVNSTPLNAVNVKNMNDLISSIESTIGAFTI